MSIPLLFRDINCVWSQQKYAIAAIFEACLLTMDIFYTYIVYWLTASQAHQIEKYVYTQ